MLLELRTRTKIVLTGMAARVVTRKTLLHHLVERSACMDKLVVHGLELGDFVAVSIDEFDNLWPHG